MNNLAGIRLVRQVFADLLPPGWTVATANLDYVHRPDNTEWQVLSFCVNGPDGKVHNLKSQEVPASFDINQLTAETAKAFVKAIPLTYGTKKDEPP